MSILEQKTQEAAERQLNHHIYNEDIESGESPYESFRIGFTDGVEWGRGPEAWISVEDGLPDKEKGKNYSKFYPVVSECEFYAAAYDFDAKDWFDRSGEEVLVTHWQPMPQLPKK
ncbi:hypothetical protein DCC81_12040 [Chitinophaga parva]|uniref:DUF551 domain-containing protein n=1 Tax=Chitinophaga parva TaxID=2169414 RepID=A0A2T7BFH6_9BACT|nr:DUF551 domain-containing protein [Chitinophaga parva]PUZ25037.1 hypothetical protein DCC81_12040 [Chitinophaga parva]